MSFQTGSQTVGPGLIGGYNHRHIEILFDLNYGLQNKINTRTWADTPLQLYPFDDDKAFTCDVAQTSPYPDSWAELWPHQNTLISLNGKSVSTSNDVYALAREQYSLTTDQYFLGRIGTNVFYWTIGNPRKVSFRSIGQKNGALSFELPKGMIDVFGVTKSVKKDVGFVVFKKSTGFFRYSPLEFVFLEFSLKEAKRDDMHETKPAKPSI